MILGFILERILEATRYTNPNYTHFGSSRGGKWRYWEAFRKSVEQRGAKRECGEAKRERKEKCHPACESLKETRFTDLTDF